MSDTTPTEALDAPVFEPPPPAEPAAEPAPSESDTRTYAGKYQSIEELEKGYIELQQRMGRGEHLQSEPEPEPAPDPMAYLPPHVDEQTWTRVAAYAGQDPAGAAQWAMANPDVLGGQLTNVLVQNWAANDPAGYTYFLVQSQMQSQPQAPSHAETYVQEQFVSNALTSAEQSLPEFDRYKEAIADRITQNEHFYGPLLEENPRAMNEIVRQLYAQIRGEEWLNTLAAQGKPQDAAVDSKKATARTMTRSTAAPSQEADDADKFAALIKSARGI